MWFVFPQIRGLGQSHTANWFAIASRGEGEAYLQHPILGERLRECTRLVNRIEGRSAYEIFGHPDDLKFCSSMTLFAQVAHDPHDFAEAIEKYYSGQFDALTLARL